LAVSIVNVCFQFVGGDQLANLGFSASEPPSRSFRVENQRC
jgi:hypothetical protein